MTDKAGSVLAKVSVPFQEYPKAVRGVTVKSREEEEKLLGLPSAADLDATVGVQKAAEQTTPKPKKKSWGG